MTDAAAEPVRGTGAALDWWGALFIVVMGTLWHFVYAWSGDNTAVGWVAPVNESVWEHTKLVAIPSLAWNGIAARRLAPRNRLAWAAFVEACTGPAVVVAGYYAYSTLLGRGWFVADILLFLVAVAAGRIVNRTIRGGTGRTPGTPVSLGLIGVLLLGFAWTTASPPPLAPFDVPEGYPAEAPRQHIG